MKKGDKGTGSKEFRKKTRLLNCTKSPFVLPTVLPFHAACHIRDVQKVAFVLSSKSTLYINHQI